MSGELDLGILLQSLSTELVDGTFAFATVADDDAPQHVSPSITFREAEVTTLILLKLETEALGIEYEFPCRMITLNVHSSWRQSALLPVLQLIPTANFLTVMHMPDLSF